MKCDKLKAETIVPQGCTLTLQMYPKGEVEEAFAELKSRIHELESMPHTDNSAVIERLSNENERLKAKLESVQATAYAESVDAGMENRKLKRALWITRTATAKSEKDRWNAHIDCGNRRNRKDPAYVKTGKLLNSSEWRKLWADIERKCRAKAEEYYK